MELDYIKPSPSRTAKVRIIAFVPLREGAGGWEALNQSKPAGETRGWGALNQSKPPGEVGTATPQPRD